MSDEGRDAIVAAAIKWHDAMCSAAQLTHDGTDAERYRRQAWEDRAAADLIDVCNKWRRGDE